MTKSLTRVEAAAYLQSHDNYVILTHIRPDGDTLGCASALCLGLRSLGKTAQVLVNTGVGCWLYFSEIARLPVMTVSILGYLEPLAAVLFAVVLLHERLSVFEAVGAVLILAGAAASEWRRGHADA